MPTNEKKPKKVDDGKPTRSMIESLLRNLTNLSLYRSSKWQEYEDLTDKLEEDKRAIIAKAFEATDIPAREAELDAMRNRINDQKNRFKEEVDKARRKYQAYGVTETVLKNLQELVEQAEQLRG